MARVDAPPARAIPLLRLGAVLFLLAAVGGGVLYSTALPLKQVYWAGAVGVRRGGAGGAGAC